MIVYNTGGGGTICLINQDTTYAAAYGTTYIPNGEWHVAHSVNEGGGSSASQIRINVDGSEDSTTNFSDSFGSTLLNDTPLTIGSRAAGGQPSAATIGEARIANVARSSAWLELDNYTLRDTLMFYNTEQTYTDWSYVPPEPDPTYYNYQGTVKEAGINVIRTVLLYRRSTGELMDSTTSSSAGYYNLRTTYNDEHFIVVLDDDAGTDYNALISDRLTPNG
jgi:hypothetical protein